MEKKLSSTSGAAKRRKLKREQECLSKVAKLTNFLKPVTTQLENQNTFTNEEKLDNNDNKDEDGIPGCSNVEEDTITFAQQVLSTETESTSTISTDIANFQNKILTDDMKKIIILSDSCRPQGPFKRDPAQNNRCFSGSFYKTSTKYGLVERLWLCYSPKLDAVYCEPCWLFLKESNDNWRTQGIRDWKGLSKKISLHERSKHHVHCCYIYQKWKNNEIIDKISEEQIRYESNFWVQVLERLVNITLAISKNCLAFRGHRESFEEVYNGNFLTQVQLLGKYDNIMKQVIDKPHGTTKYLSHQIQDEIIHCLATHLKTILISDLNNAPFYTIIMDTTQDITKKDQLSRIFRYVKIIKNERDEPTGIEIRENFLGFLEIHDHSASGLYNEILNFLENYNIKLSKCRGQGYDGANVMSGAYNGVQALLKKDQPNAMYIHCVSHNLNLVINDAVKSWNEVSEFFTTVENIYTFFGYNIKRWDLLSKFTGESQITLKKLNPTRWAGRYTSLAAIKLRFTDILKALSELCLKSEKKEEREEASRLIKKMNRFEFVFLCVILFKILSETNLASKLLQSKSVDLITATKSLQTANKNLQQYRNMYTSVKNEAVQIAAKWNITPTFFWKRQRIVKKTF